MIALNEYETSAARLMDADRRLRAHRDGGGARRPDDDGKAHRLADDLVRATADVDAGDAESSPEPESMAAVSDRLANALLSLQAGGLLLDAGLADQGGRTAAEAAAVEASPQAGIEETRRAVGSQGFGRLGFDSALHVSSKDAEEARQTFLRYSKELLAEIVSQLRAVLTSALGKLGKSATALRDLIARMGEGIALPEGAGRLVDRGLELIRRALDALKAMFGRESSEHAKELAEELSEHLDGLEDAVLRRLLGAALVEERVAEILNDPSPSREAWDRATNKLSAIGNAFGRNKELLRHIVDAAAIAAPLLALIPSVAAGVPLAVGVVYATVAGAALLVGNQYTGQRRWLANDDGVRQVAEAIRTA